MAVTTVWLIRQGGRQHKDRLKPICVLMPYNGIDPLNMRGQLIETISPSPENPGFGTLKIKCVLRNVGAGPALNLRITFFAEEMRERATRPWELSPLGAGESRGDESSPLLIPVHINQAPDRFPSGFLQSEFSSSSMTGGIWAIRLEYEDVFGTRFCTVHHKSPLQGRAPDYRPQPWVTFDKY
ncbi:MAG: hypothetical protein ACRECU_07415 [Methylocella sp.]